MHTLPFGANITERLLRLVRTASTEHEGLLAQFTWIQERPSGRWSWLLCFPSKDTIPADRVFIVDGLPIYIAQEAEALLRGRVIDWSEKAGLVIHENVV